MKSVSTSAGAVIVGQILLATSWVASYFTLTRLLLHYHLRLMLPMLASSVVAAPGLVYLLAGAQYVSVARFAI